MPDSRPNIIFIITDQQRYDTIRGLGFDYVDTPHLDRLINEGVVLTLPTSNHIYFSFVHDQAAFDEIAAAVVTVLDKYPFAEAYRDRTKGS